MDPELCGFRAELLNIESLINKPLNQQAKLHACLVELEPAGLDVNLPMGDNVEMFCLTCLKFSSGPSLASVVKGKKDTLIPCFQIPRG